MASSLRRKMGSSRWLRESGNVIVGAPFMVIGLLMGFGVTYSGYRVYQENIEQDRRARSIGLAALKAYDLAGCEYDHVNRNAGRVRFAVDAARRAMDVENVESMPLPSISIPAGGTSGPIEAVFEDSTGGTRGKVTLRLGSVDDMSDGTLGVLKPCVAATTYLNLTTPQVDDWLPNQPFQASLIPADFDWRTYLATYPDLTAHNPPLDTEAEARRHFALYGVHEAGRTVWTPRHREAHEFIAAEVTVHGLSSTDRSGQFAKLFGANTLSRSTSKAIVVRDVGVQPLQVGEVEIGTSPPPFKKPVLDRSKVSYTMSMDVKLAQAGTDWRNIFNSSKQDCCNTTTRRPAVFISGSNTGQASRILIVHGANPSNGTSFWPEHDRNGDNRHVLTSFAASPNVYFNVTWTVDRGTLKTYINGLLNVQATTGGDFTWGEENWQWNAYLTQHPGRAENTAGSVKVKNVLWWNRPLAASEIQALQGSRGPQVHSFEVP
jgi:hypothetical protein